MHILHETWRWCWLTTSDVIFWSVVFVQSFMCWGKRLLSPSLVLCELRDGLFVAWSWEAAESDTNWSRFRWCWEHCSICWFFPFQSWAVKEGFSEGEKELKGLNIWELSSALWRGAFGAVVFLVRWKDGVDRGKRGRCTSMQVCSCHREKVLTLLCFFYNTAKGAYAE